MSDNSDSRSLDLDLYDMVERRINQRNRRRLLWAVNLAGLVLSLAVMIAFNDTAAVDLLVAVFLGWGGLFTFHTIWLAMAETRTREIEQEVDRLRQSQFMTEKPKRLALPDEGERVDDADDAALSESQARRLSAR